MSDEGEVERRLAAIFAADVEGYSRLMDADEVAALRSLTERRRIMDALIASRRGRIANTAGDSVLAEFSSAVDAVRCAVDVQSALAKINEGVAADRRVNFRIGVHVGDVMVRAGDLFGDGVNIAARLQTLASAGGVCVPGAAHDHVRKVLALGFTDLGAQAVKNISEPVRAWAVSAQGETAAASAPAAGLTPVPGDGKPLPLPDKPSIAVLPFQNMSGDPEQEYFADGMVEDIITALSRKRWLFVIARNSSFTYKGNAIDIKQVGRELGVRYVLEGSVRKSGHRLRITGQLIDTVTGAHLWADRFEGGIEDIFELQDQVTASVVGAISPRLEQAEIERSRRKPTENLQAYDYYLQGISCQYKFTKEMNGQALQLFHKAINLDPEFASAFAQAANAYSQRKAMRWNADRASEAAQAELLARTALDLARDDPAVLVNSGMALAFVAGHLEEGAGI